MRTTVRYLVLLLLTTPLLTACEEAVDPVLEGDMPFSLYGYLDPGQDVQALRVYPIDPILEMGAPEHLGADIRLRGPSTDVALRDSIILFADGEYGHVFYARFQPDFATTYRIDARDARGREAFVNVRTPAKAELELDTATGVLGNVRMPARFINAEQVLSPRVVYSFESTRAPFAWTIPVVYGDVIRRDGQDTWAMTVDLSRDIGVLYAVTGLQPGTDPIVLNRMEVQAFVATSDWTPPGGRFDRDLLVQPGVFSNVENGFGFVGSGYVERARALPDAATLRLAGFANQ